MKITDLVVKKIDHSDPRFPDTDARFTDVYLLTAKLDDGTEQECPFFFSGNLTPDKAADMMRLFAGALDRMVAQAAA